MLDNLSLGGSAPPSLAVDIRPAPQRVVVAPRGELDSETVGPLAAEIDDLVGRGFTSIVLDLRGLEFLDSAGLWLLMRQAARADATVTMVEGGGAVSRLLDVTRMRAHLPFEAAG
jgi:anti-sigma B factor antagonist